MAANKDDRSLARRAKPVSGPVEDYEPEPEADEGPSPEDIARFGEVTVRCPKCRTDLHDDVAICWQCGHRLMESDQGGVPLWSIIVALVLIGLLLMGYAASVIF